ncbi:MAG: NAD-binding protein, partial [Chthoniobacterales bacterium]
MKARRIVVIGRSDVGRRVCSLLSTSGISVVHLHEPSDADVRAELGKEIDGVAVMLHDDIKALRYGLMVHHIRPDARLFVAMFDRTARAQLRNAVPGCVVLSPAAISVPAMVAGAIHPDADAVRRASTPEVPAWVAVKYRGKEGASIETYRTPESVKTRGLLGRLAGQFRPYDSGTRVLLGGAAGLIAIICADTLVGLAHANFLRSLYDATRTTATISAPALPDEPWLLIWATATAVFVMCFTAMFAAGIVNYLLSGRHAAIFGKRVAPRFGHVIVVGMGQVGLRLAQELQALGVAVIGIEQDANARSLPIARSSGIPVLIGDGASKAVLAAAGAHRAIALVAAGSEERDNIAVAVAALAANPQLRVVLRSGSDDAIEETRSLFRIGAVVDVNGLTASFVAASLDDKSPFAIIPTPDGDMAIDESGAATEFWPPHPVRCSC